MALSKHGDFKGLGLLQLDIAPPMPAGSGGWGFGRGSKYGRLFQLHIRLHQVCKFSKKMHTDYRYTHARNTPPHTHNHNLCHMYFLLPNHISTRFSCKTGICCGWEARWSTLQMHCVTDMDHLKV